MKSYLSLIPISAKINKRKNKLTLLCIIFAVFLVTTIFSMAEMGIRMEKDRLLAKHGIKAFSQFSKSPTVQSLYFVSIFLFLLILLAGVLMISSSINSNVAQKTKFFGMMRCIGMSKKQIIKFVRLEALNWCKIAIPIGTFSGVISSFLLSALLKFSVGGEFSNINIFVISPVAIFAGVVMGILTVLIAASSPAKKASRVSPISAVSGNSENQNKTNRTIENSFLKIEYSLGINHALSNKKNFFMMLSSFSLSIILFLSFSVLINLIDHIMPQYSNRADIAISISDGKHLISKDIMEEISSFESVEEVFSRKSSLNMTGRINSSSTESKVDVVSYDNFDLDSLKKDHLLKRGSSLESVKESNDHVIAIFDKNNPLKINDSINIENKNFKVAAILKVNPFSDDGESDGKINIITSNKGFYRLTNIKDSSLLLIQMNKNSSDNDFKKIKELFDENYIVKDMRQQNTSASYIAFSSFIYSFLLIISLVTVLNIMNSISISVSSRINQYGDMIAIGMTKKQVNKMIAAEAFTYAISGGLIGCLIAIPINKLLYNTLISSHFTFAVWTFPIFPLGIILLFILFATAASLYAPYKLIKNKSTVNLMNSL